MAQGNNNNLKARRLELVFKDYLQTVFEVRSYFGDFFAGGLQALDGVKENETAFYIKTSDIPVVVQEYSTDANTAFEKGTGDSNRFGPRREIIYVDTPVPYTWQWAFHEGLDRATVNNDMNAALADRLDLQAQKKVVLFNQHHGAYISSIAEKTETLDAMTEADVKALFNEMSKYFVNIHTVGRKVAKVNSEIWNILIDAGYTVKEKDSSVNIDRNEMIAFKGFDVEELPDDAFEDGEVAYFYVVGIGAAFTGINTTRTFESEDFDGLALQGHGKAGEYVLPDNRKAVAKATYGSPEPPVPSSEKKITSFVIDSVNAKIDDDKHDVQITLPAGTDKSSLTPTIEVSAKASVSPASGVATDFTNTVTYTVTAEDGTTQDYTVEVTVEE